MINTRGASQRARWAVMWIATNGRTKKLIRKNFGDDHASALKLYSKVLAANKPYPTLACVNMGFPPPEELRPRQVRKRGRSKKTGKLVTVDVTVQPLKELNLQGQLWCPYCMELRPFTLKTSYRVNGIRVADPIYICPICKISQRDHHVRYWNPTAAIHMESTLSTKRRGPTKTTTRRRRSRA